MSTERDPRDDAAWEKIDQVGDEMLAAGKAGSAKMPGLFHEIGVEVNTAPFTADELRDLGARAAVNAAAASDPDLQMLLSMLGLASLQARRAIMRNTGEKIQ